MCPCQGSELWCAAWVVSDSAYSIHCWRLYRHVEFAASCLHRVVRELEQSVKPKPKAIWYRGKINSEKLVSDRFFCLGFCGMFFRPPKRQKFCRVLPHSFSLRPRVNAPSSHKQAALCCLHAAVNRKFLLSTVTGETIRVAPNHGIFLYKVVHPKQP